MGNFNLKEAIAGLKEAIYISFTIWFRSTITIERKLLLNNKFTQWFLLIILALSLELRQWLSDIKSVSNSETNFWLSLIISSVFTTILSILLTLTLHAVAKIFGGKGGVIELHNALGLSIAPTIIPLWIAMLGGFFLSMEDAVLFGSVLGILSSLASCIVFISSVKLVSGLDNIRTALVLVSFLLILIVFIFVI